MESLACPATVPENAYPIRGPLMLTLHISSPLQSSINDLRTEYFPPHRLLVPGHLTLFHALPSSPPSLSAVLEDLQSAVDTARPFAIHAGEVFKMGQRGVGIDVSNHEIGREKITKLRSALLRRWIDRGLTLTNQDRQTLKRPHFTIMNKESDLEKVEACFAEVRRRMGEDRMWKTGVALGIEVWEYLVGGRWRFVRLFKFRQ
ncbi:hypothetical protein OE88DRAFT_1664264 [Heliocybe sulcata]|uniref:LigT-like protein n=1 Tax=Heliocybe sulcata TaxID=5364 RepID=A0A5C3MWB9_9AGAM|nr:hypothetical protein OE88DRAFT_1664264 [Heliocybe sulcata]